MSVNWLPLSHRKNISQVKVIVEDDVGQSYGGYYTPGSKILVAVYRSHGGGSLEATIAHEYRHHIQYETNNISLKIVSFNTNTTYEKAIRQYYRSSLSELDALVYEYKYAKSDLNEWWLKELVDDKGICKRYF